MDARILPIDQQSAERLAADGLTLGLVDTSDREALAAWDEADYRGFHDRRPEQEMIDQHQRLAAYRRTTGVWDASIPEPGIPVATVASWVDELAVPGGAVDAWAISSVTVAPTHRRRGIARALLESELRTAAAAGVPVASLTVSEATIYGRFGFGPATQVGDLTIDTKRAGWSGPVAPGRIGFVALQTLVETARDIADRARRATPGDFALDEHLWGSLVGTIGDHDKQSASLRAVRYDDERGEPQGFVVYKLVENKSDFTKHTVDVRYLRAATDDAYAAIWRFLVDLDLVAKVRYDVASADEPVLWMLRDIRAASVTLHDHHWLRILDVKAALEARTYGAPASLAIRVRDDLAFARGTFRLDVSDDGSAIVTETDTSPDLTMNVTALSALYLGGAKATTLARAGRVVEHRPHALSRFDASFRADVTPHLSFWY
jgi:predicted acetyltransferase